MQTSTVILEGGNTLTESTKSFTDLLANSAGSPDAAAALLSLAGVVFGLVGKIEAPFTQALAAGVGVNAGALGVVIGGIQLGAAIDQYKDAMAGYDGAAQKSAYENLADKTCGIIAGIGGTMAAIPGLQPLGLAIWLGASLAQQYTNGNVGRLVDFMKWNAFHIDPNVNGTTPDPLVKTIIYVDPLILDLDGDGLEITPLSKGILFDANGDSIKTGTAWAGADDGMLVWDRDGNGLIDSGRELFGDETILANGQKAAHGFAALSELDKGSVINGVTVGASDGVFDAKDAQYTSLRIWRDLNLDGISQAGELQTLAQSGVTSIQLGSSATNTQYGDAILSHSGTFTRANGNTQTGNAGTAELAGSLLLANNNFYRQFTYDPQVSSAAAALPQMQGSGVVRGCEWSKRRGFGMATGFAHAMKKGAACARQMRVNGSFD